MFFRPRQSTRRNSSMPLTAKSTSVDAGRAFVLDRTFILDVPGAVNAPIVHKSDAAHKPKPGCRVRLVGAPRAVRSIDHVEAGTRSTF